MFLRNISFALISGLLVASSAIALDSATHSEEKKVQRSMSGGSGAADQIAIKVAQSDGEQEKSDSARAQLKADLGSQVDDETRKVVRRSFSGGNGLGDSIAVGR